MNEVRNGTKNQVVWTPAQVAEMYAVSPAFVYREVKRGHLRAARLGRGLRITPDDAARWFEAALVAP